MNPLTKSIKPISQLLNPTSKTLYISLFSSSSSSSQSPSPYHISSSSYRRQDEESRAVSISVWWDIENCGVPEGVNVFKIAQSITNAVRANGIKGPVKITAFGDVHCLDRVNQQALSSTGVSLTHIPNGGKNGADRSLLVDLMYWVSQNPPPAHIFLITGDKDFAGILHKLRMSNYNILLAAKEAKNTSSGVLYSAASIMWYWNELAKGENLLGKHFNQPPDGPFNSWYGHYRGALEDAFAVLEPKKEVESESSSNAELSSNGKIRPVPMTVFRELCGVVNSNPKGLKINELSVELMKRNVFLNKDDYYGHKKLSRLLLSLPHIVKVEYCNDGQLLLKPVLTPSPELVESNTDVTSPANTKANGVTPTITRMVEVNDKPSKRVSENEVGETKNAVEEISEIKVSVKKNAVEENVLGVSLSESDVPPFKVTRMVDVNDKPSKRISEKEVDLKKNTMEETSEIKMNVKKNTVEEKRSEETSEKNVLGVSQSGSDGKEALNSEIHENRLTHTEERNSKAEDGLFKKLWIKLFGHKMDSTKLLGYDVPEKPISEEQSKPSNKAEVLDPVHSSSDTPLNVVLKADDTIEKSKASPGFIGKIINWCKFGKSETPVDKPVESPTEEQNQNPAEEDPKKFVDDAPHSKELVADAPHSKELVADDASQQRRKHNLFTKDSFWKALRSFFKTRRGSEIVLNSQSRKQIAERLQKEGPLILEDLQTTDIYHLVELLLEETKWIKEFPTKHPRFKLSLNEKTSAPSQPNNPTGLSSIFLHSESDDNPFFKASSVAHKKPSEKSRIEILSDCEKLLNEVLSENPDGISIGLFKNQFLDKYGYTIDYKKLGYPKLVNLLQVLPSVKVESTRVFPDNVVYALGVQSLGVKENENEVESLWEELGPLEKSNARKTEGEYEVPTFEDDELSDTDTDTDENEHYSASSFLVKVEEKKSTGGEEDSPLLQIMEAWYGPNDKSNSKDKSRSQKVNEPNSNRESSPGSSDDEKPPSMFMGAIKDEFSPSVNNLGRKNKSQKVYTFVASEGAENEKGKLLGGILDTLNSDDVRVQR